MRMTLHYNCKFCPAINHRIYERKEMAACNYTNLFVRTIYNQYTGWLL
jgi:hypothetical protein